MAKEPYGIVSEIIGHHENVGHLLLKKKKHHTHGDKVTEDAVHNILKD